MQYPIEIKGGIKMKNTKDFLNNLKENDGLKKELEQYLADSGCKNETEALEAIVRFACDKGYEIDTDDFEHAKQELGDDDLANISGGGVLQRLKMRLRPLLDFLGIEVLDLN